MRPGDARPGGRGRRRRPPRRGPQPRRGFRPRWPGFAPPWPPAGGEWAQVDLLQCPLRELTADPACPRAARRTQGSSPQVPAEDLAQRAEAPSRDSDWKAALRSLAASLRGLAHVHPYAYGLLFGRGLLPEPALRTFDASLASLERAGLDRQAAAEMHRTLLSFAVGYGLLELPAASLSGSTELERLVSIARAVPRDAPVKLVEVAKLMADCHMKYQFQLGLHLIITGLAVRLKEEK